jgi:hypothetical protein
MVVMKLNKSEQALMDLLTAKGGELAIDLIYSGSFTQGKRQWEAAKSLESKGLIVRFNQSVHKSSRITARIFSRLDGCMSVVEHSVMIKIKN